MEFAAQDRRTAFDAPEQPHGIRNRLSQHITKMLYVASWFEQYKAKP